MLARRTFLASLGGALLSRPARAGVNTTQELPTVGVLMGLADDKETQARASTFEEGLRQKGWIAGENLPRAYRYADGAEARLERYAAELVGLKCDCILGQSTPVAAALQKLTRTIPIVFVAVTDPIGSGFVQSLAHPGGNITGFTIVQAKIAGKYLSMLEELSPHLSHAALMYNPDAGSFARTFFTPAFIDAARALGIEPIIAEVRSATDIGTAIERLADSKGGALITVPDNFLSLYRHLIVELAAKFRIPAGYPYRYFAEAGGLLSYGMDAVNSFDRATDYVSRILRGAKPADLPVQEPTKFELVINVRTAKALGLTVPRILLAGAVVVIE